MLPDQQEWKRSLKEEKGRTRNPYSNEKVIYKNQKSPIDIHLKSGKEIGLTDKIYRFPKLEN